MKKKIDDVMNDVTESYKNLADIANQICKPMTAEIDLSISQAVNVKDLTDSQIRNLIILLSLKCYSLAETRDYAVLKSACAKTVKEQAYSAAFNSLEGTVGAKNNYATEETVSESMVEHVYSLVSSILKTKVDEVHRIVDALKSALMSRMSEAKLVNGTRPAYED